MVMNSILFGAGRGKRLRPLSDRLPKPALPVLDIPLAAWGLAALARGAPPVVVNGSHLAGGLMESLDRLHIEHWSPFVEAPEALGTAGTLRALRSSLGPTVVTWNGDLLTDLRPEDLLAAHARGERPGTLAVRPVESGADLAIEDGRVRRFIDRRREDAPGAQFLGIAAFERSALEDLPDEHPAGLGETLLKTLADRGVLGVHEFSGYWRDVGTPDAYLSASLDVLNEAAPAPPVALPGSIVDVNGGSAYVGPGAQVQESSLGPGAIVLSDAVIDPNAVLSNCVVFPGGRVPSDARVADVVWFEDGALPPPGA